MATVNDIAEFLPVDTRASSGTIVLPQANSIPGRVLTFKDMYGTFGFSSLTLSTQASDFFEDLTSTKILSNTFGYATFVSGSNQWFLTDGTIFPMYTLSSLRAPLRVATATISTTLLRSPLSSLATTVSSFGLVDTQTQETFTLYTRSTLLYYGSLVVGGSKASAGQILPVV